MEKTLQCGLIFFVMKSKIFELILILAIVFAGCSTVQTNNEDGGDVEPKYTEVGNGFEDDEGDGEEQISSSDGDENGYNPFYYNFDEKVFIQQIENNIFLHFLSNIDKEQLFTLINSDATLQPTSRLNIDEGYFNFVVLESKDGMPISSVSIESFKKRPEVVSATFMFKYNETLHAITNEFVVMLNETTQYTQLQKLAEQNYCEVGEEDQFVKNKFTVSVPKTSELNAMQMSNLFYETNLFEFAAPNFFILTTFINR